MSGLNFVTGSLAISLLHVFAVYFCAVVIKAPYIVTWFASILTSGFLFIMLRRLDPEWRAQLRTLLSGQNRLQSFEELSLGVLMYAASSIACWTIIYRTYGGLGLMVVAGSNAVASAVI